jgi:hypothetical protein
LGRREGPGVVTGGFGWSFYGFFVFAAAWIAAYFAWAAWMNRRTEAEGRRPGPGGQGPRERPRNDHGMSK